MKSGSGVKQTWFGNPLIEWSELIGLTWEDHHARRSAVHLISPSTDTDEKVRINFIRFPGPLVAVRRIGCPEQDFQFEKWNFHQMLRLGDSPHGDPPCNNCCDPCSDCSEKFELKAIGSSLPFYTASSWTDFDFKFTLICSGLSSVSYCLFGGLPLARRSIHFTAQRFRLFGS